MFRLGVGNSSGREPQVGISPGSRRYLPLFFGAVSLVATGCVGPNDTNAFKEVGWAGGRRDSAPGKSAEAHVPLGDGWLQPGAVGAGGAEGTEGTEGGFRVVLPA